VSAQLGARLVVATDNNALALDLVRAAAAHASDAVDRAVETRHFDLFSGAALPRCDVLVCSDMMYDGVLATQLGRRCAEALAQTPPPLVVVTDSQRYGHSDVFLAQIGAQPGAAWRDVKVDGFTGSGLLVDADQTYDSTTRLLVLGGNRRPAD